MFLGCCQNGELLSEEIRKQVPASLPDISYEVRLLNYSCQDAAPREPTDVCGQISKQAMVTTFCRIDEGGALVLAFSKLLWVVLSALKSEKHCCVGTQAGTGPEPH